MNPNEVDNFLKESNGEENPFVLKNDDPFHTEAAKADEGDKGTEGEGEGEKSKDEDLPFHKNPKVQRFIEKELNKKLAELKPTETEKFIASSGEAEDEASEVLARIIGNDTPEKVAAIRDFKKVLNGLEEKSTKKALAQFQDQIREEKEAERQHIQFLQDGIFEIEDAFNVDLTSNSPIAKKTHNDFLEFVKKIAPKDEEGNIKEYPDLQATFETFREITKKSSSPTGNRAKEIASRGMSRSSDASNAKPRVNNWNDVDKAFSKLSN